jgi:hypothetical protein
MSYGESRDGMAIIQFPVVLFCTYFAKTRPHDEDGRARVRSSFVSELFAGSSQLHGNVSMALGSCK